eukprot:scaffold253161_cov23-Tisochrysis_lutea.AAC.1
MASSLVGSAVSHKFVGYGVFSGKVVSASGDRLTVEWEDGYAAKENEGNGRAGDEGERGERGASTG